MMNVLIDTSVWVEHFRTNNIALVELLELDWAVYHPMVLGELACGTPPEPREKTLRNIALLRSCNEASLKEVMWFIENNGLYGKGCGLVDMCLLASAMITPETQLWTLDKRLLALARELRIAYEP